MLLVLSASHLRDN